MSANDVAEADGPARGTGPVARSVTGSSMTRLVLAGAIAAAVVVLGVTHWTMVDAGGDSLARADRDWLVLAALATAAIWIAGSVAQLGSMPVRLPLGRVLAVQVAASFANHVLPAGAGGMGVNIRFLRRHGLGSGAAVGSVGLNSLAGMAAHVLLLLAAVVISPSVARSVDVPDWLRSVTTTTGRPLWWGLLALGAVLLIALLVASRARRRRRPATDGEAAGGRLRRELAALWAVVRDPYRAAALWLGSLSAPLLHAIILFAVLRSLGVAVTVGTAVVVYVVVSSLSAVVPSPGGVGALDVTLLAGLAAVGVSSAVAIGAVVGYRLITVWVPLLPSAVVLAVLLRRRII
jgi:uncharacterized protein (TIRG00374 family)